MDLQRIHDELSRLFREYGYEVQHNSHIDLVDMDHDLTTPFSFYPENCELTARFFLKKCKPHCYRMDSSMRVVEGE